METRIAISAITSFEQNGGKAEIGIVVQNALPHQHHATGSSTENFARDAAGSRNVIFLLHFLSLVDFRS